MMSNTDVMKVEVVAECCCICGLAGELATPEEYDSASGGAAPLRTALLHLNNNKLVPEGRLCGACAQRAVDAHDFSSSLAARAAPPPLSDKIRALRRRLHDLTQKIDVFIVVGGPGATGTYSEDDIIMVERSALAGTPGAAPTEGSEDLESGLDGDLEAPHITNAKGDTVYQCTVCPMSFPSVESYRAHAAAHPADARHSCWQCGAQFPARPELRRHARDHQLDTTKCHLCGTQFKSAALARAHWAGAVCGPCPECGLRLGSRAALGAHAGQHAGLCGACFLRLPGRAALAAHALSHRAARRFVCAVGQCVLRFTKREHLLHHIRTQHHQELPEESAEDKHTCAVCNRTFASGPALKRHARVHKNQEAEDQEYQEPQVVEKVEAVEAVEEFQWEDAEGDVEYLEVETLEEEAFIA